MLLLEAADSGVLVPLVNQPDQPRKRRNLTAASLSLFSLVNPGPLLVHVDVWQPGSGDIRLERSIQYQALAFTQPAPAAPADLVPVPSWEAKGPERTLLVRHPQLPQAVDAVRYNPPAVPAWKIEAPSSPRRWRPPQPPQPFTPVAIAAPALVSIAEWGIEPPSRNATAPVFRPEGMASARPFDLGLFEWHQAWPSSRVWVRVQHPEPTGPFFVQPPVPFVDVDKWLTGSPVPNRWRFDRYGAVSWEVGEFVAPPEPPEPPEPPVEVRRRKPMIVRVQHLKRPPGGFNTIFYVDDDDR